MVGLLRFVWSTEVKQNLFVHFWMLLSLCAYKKWTFIRSGNERFENGKTKKSYLRKIEFKIIKNHDFFLDDKIRFERKEQYARQTSIIRRLLIASRTNPINLDQSLQLFHYRCCIIWLSCKCSTRACRWRNKRAGVNLLSQSWIKCSTAVRCVIVTVQKPKCWILVSTYFFFLKLQ